MMPFLVKGILVSMLKKSLLRMKRLKGKSRICQKLVAGIEKKQKDHRVRNRVLPYKQYQPIFKSEDILLKTLLKLRAVSSMIR